MAQIALGNVVTDIRGTLNGNVFSANAYGPYVRNKVTPINRATSYQTQARAAFAAASAAWGSALTESDRQAWRGFSKDHPFSTIFGRQRHLDGHAMYIKCNAALANAELAEVTLPPSSTETGLLGALDLIATVAAGGTLTVATDESGIDAGSQINFYATRVMPNGRNFVKSELNFIGSVASGGTPYDIKTAWEDKYGTFPTVANGKIFVQLQIITVEGWMSIPSGTSSFVS